MLSTNVCSKDMTNGSLAGLDLKGTERVARKVFEDGMIRDKDGTIKLKAR